MSSVEERAHLHSGCIVFPYKCNLRMLITSPTTWEMMQNLQWVCLQFQVLVVVGGQAPKAIRSVECYDFAEERWYQVSELPSRRCRAGKYI